MNTGEIISLVAAISSFVTIIITIFLFSKTLKEQTKIQKADFIYRLNDKYDQICSYRCNNSKLFDTGLNWEDKPLHQMNSEEKSYYFFEYMTLGFFEIAVYATKVSKVLSDEDLELYLKPVMRKEVEMNPRILAHFSNSRALSDKTKEFIRGLLGEVKVEQSRKSLNT